MSASAQIDSVLLDSTVISLRGISNTSSINAIQLNNKSSLGEVLTLESLVFVKPTGGNALSTISIRGGTPEQSPVFWNGLNLQNTLNGNIDIALLPAFIFDAISINASAATNSGSGVIAGSVELKNNKIDTIRSLKAIVGFGAFGLTNVAVKTIIPSDKSTWSIAAFRRSAKNNYPYQTSSAKTKPLEHARFDLSGVLIQNQLRFKNYSPLNIRLWWQQSNREIPATTLEARSLKYQIDKSIRLQSDWSKVQGKNEWKFIFGSFNEQLKYRDSVANIYNDYLFSNNSALIHYKRLIESKLRLGVDLEGRFFGADADTFYNQNRIELSEAIHLKHDNKNLQTHSGLRWVQFNGISEKPILFSFKANKKIDKSYSLSASFSTNYRLPTFNSLYWNPGGNPNLGPERSTNAEMQLRFKRKDVIWTATAYSNYIQDQMRWLPGNDGIFAASQIVDQTQWNKGVETSTQINLKRFLFIANGTIMKSNVVGDKRNLQQTFVPQIQANTSLRYNWSKWSVVYGNSFIGKRFVDADNEEFLPSISLHRLSVEATFKDVSFYATIQNLLNEYYTVLPFRPNQPRNFLLNISYKILNNKK
ncbi:MAG: vitamin B12 transporter [bacterium]|jgi:vitamin B12 transporter